MKLLILLSRIPYPLEKGDKLRAFEQIKGLAKNHEIILVAMSDNKIHPLAFDTLKEYCAEIHIFPLPIYFRILALIKALFKALPFQVAYFYHPFYQNKLNEIISQNPPDIVYCQLVRMTEYLRLQTKYHPKTVLDYMDTFSQGILRRKKIAPFWLKPLLNIEYRRLIKYENKVFDLFAEKTIISEQDRNHIPHPKNNEIHIIQNGVNTDYFTPQNIDRLPNTLLFTGNMAYAPNVEAAKYLAKEILPLVQKKIPKINLILAGATPDKEVKALAADNITVTGWVDDIRPYYAQCSLFVAPMQIGTGLQNKLLEAMSMGTPCITTSLCNSALQAENNKEIIIADTAELIAEKIVELLSDNKMQNEIGSSGKLFVEKKYKWEAANNQLNELLISLIK